MTRQRVSFARSESWSDGLGWQAPTANAELFSSLANGAHALTALLGGGHSIRKRKLLPIQNFRRQSPAPPPYPIGTRATSRNSGLLRNAAARS
jgi:hypothetical protein